MFDKWSGKFNKVQAAAKDRLQPLAEEAESLGRKLSQKPKKFMTTESLPKLQTHLCPKMSFKHCCRFR